MTLNATAFGMGYSDHANGKALNDKPDNWSDSHWLNYQNGVTACEWELKVLETQGALINSSKVI